MVHGDIGTFLEDKEPVESYLERFDFYCQANSIVQESQKKAIFLSTVGHAAYEKIKDLMHPVSVRDACLEDIFLKLTQHYKPQTVEIAERYKFFKCIQKQGDNVGEYIADLREESQRLQFWLLPGHRFTRPAGLWSK